MAVGNSADLTGAIIGRIVQDQPWYKAHANTITTAVGFLLTLVTWLASSPFVDQPWAAPVIFIVGFVATVVGVKNTRNGFSPSQLRKIQDAQGEVIGETPLVVSGAEAESTLSEQIRKYNEAE